MHNFIQNRSDMRFGYSIIIWFGLLSLSLNYELSGCWDIQLLIFWGHLPLKLVFILRSCKIWFGQLSLSLNEYDPISGFWDIQVFNILRLSSIRGRLHSKDLENMVCSSKLKSKISVWSNKWLQRYSTFKLLRPSSIGGCHNLFKIWWWWVLN